MALGGLLDSSDQLMHFLIRFGAKVLKHGVNQIKWKGDSFLLVHTNSILQPLIWGSGDNPVSIMPKGWPKAKAAGSWVG